MILGITTGDGSGVGPEILLHSFQQGEWTTPAVVFGDLAVIEYYNESLGYGVPLHRIERPEEYRQGVLNVIDHGMVVKADVTPGKLSRAAGAAAREYVVQATRSALAKSIAAIVTLPMNKEATQLTDPSFVGHTELIGEVCGVQDVTIMLASEQLIVTHVTTHVSLLKAISCVKKDRICTILRFTVDAVRKLRPNGRIAVAGLNPHAGENGLFGREDLDEIAPAVAWAQAQGMPVEGPFPADTLFYLAVKRGRYDAIVCMYHDQGHVPLKLLDFECGVNVALGLPIIRTSVDHGTAFDIAGKGVASTRSFIEAMNFAVRLTAVGPVG